MRIYIIAGFEAICKRFRPSRRGKALPLLHTMRQGPTPENILRGFLCAIPAIQPVRRDAAPGRRAVRRTSCGRSPTCLPCAASRRTTPAAAVTAAIAAAAPAPPANAPPASASVPARPAPAPRARAIAPAIPAPARPVPVTRAAVRVRQAVRTATTPDSTPSGAIMRAVTRAAAAAIRASERRSRGLFAAFRVKTHIQSGGAPTGRRRLHLQSYSFTRVSVTLSPLMSTSFIKPSEAPSKTLSASTSFAKAAEASASFARPSAV